MEAISIKDFGHDQCQVMVGKYRVAYVCYGKGKPINWLTKATSGLSLTDSEKLEVARFVRQEMSTRTQQRNSAADELAAISSPNYKATDATDKRSDSPVANKTQAARSPGS